MTTHGKTTLPRSMRWGGIASVAAVLAGMSPVAAQDVTLSYALWDAAQVPAMEQIIAEFREEHPGIDVKIQVTPWDDYWTKLQTSATGGSAPDVFWMTLAYFKYYAGGGALLPITDKIAADNVDLSPFVPAMVEAYSFNGENFGMPKDVNSFALFYNKDLFTEAGVAFPDDTWTWEDVKTAAAALTRAEDGIYGVAAPLSDQLGWYLTIPQAGGYVLSEDGKTSGFDQPEAIRAVQFWVDLVQSGVSPSLQQLTDTDALSLFTSGKVAMYYGGSWNPVAIADVPAAKEFTDVAPLPKDENGSFYSNGLGYTIYSRTAHPEEAWTFVKFLSSRRGNEIQSSTGTVIPAYMDMGSNYVEAMPWLNAQVFIDQLPNALPFPVSTRTAAWRQIVTRGFAPAWMGEISVEEAAKAVTQQVNESLASE